MHLCLLSALLVADPACQQGSPRKEPTVAELKADPDNAEKSLTGLPLDKAKALAEAAGIPHRVIEIEGQVQPATMDLRVDRLNFTVEEGVVTKITKG